LHLLQKYVIIVINFSDFDCYRLFLMKMLRQEKQLRVEIINNENPIMKVI